MELSGKVVLITGGAQGIGKATCELFLSRGCKVSCLDVKSEKGEETVKYFQENYGKDKAIFIKCDVSSESELEAAYLETNQKLGNVDILVNNAGAGGPRTVEVNLIGVINGCNIAYKYMGKQNGGKGGAVISVSSIAGLLPVPFIPVYAATKAAVIGLTRSYGTQLHYDLTGITFTAVCPGPTNTEIYWSKSESIHFLAEYEKLREKTTPSEPVVVAEGILQLLKDGRNGGVMTVIPGQENAYVNLCGAEDLLRL